MPGPSGPGRWGSRLFKSRRDESHVLCFGNNLGYDEQIPEKFQAIVLKAVEEGRIKKERIEEAYERVMRLKEQ